MNWHGTCDVSAIILRNEETVINVIVILGLVFFAFVVVVAIKVAMAGRPPPREIKLAPLQAADPVDVDKLRRGQ